MGAAGAIAAAFALAGAAGTARADPVKVVKGDTFASIARTLYGDTGLEGMLRAANGAGAGDEPVAGVVITAPNARPLKLAAGDTWPALATKYLGDPRRAALLARENSFDPAKPMPPPGTTVYLPFLAKHTAGKDEPWTKLAAAFYRDARKGELIREFNLAPKGKKKPKAGESVAVPIFHARFKKPAGSGTADVAAAATAAPETAAPASASARTAAATGPAAAAATRLLDAAEAAYADGAYAGVIALLAAPLGTPPAAPDETYRRLLELLGSSYVALDDGEGALRAFRALHLAFPAWAPDPARTSPKVLKWVDKARP